MNPSSSAGQTAVRAPSPAPRGAAFRRLYAVGLLIAAAILAQSPARTDDAELTRRVWELTKQARTLTNEGRLEEAEGKLLQARALMPEWLDIYAHLGYVYELQGRREDALHAYAQILHQRPSHQYAAEHLQALFYEGLFPRRLLPRDLELSPVKFVCDRCLLARGETTVVTGIAYTDDLLFHEDMERGGPPVEVEVPAAAGREKAIVNRSTYGYTMPPEGTEFSLRFILSYPSRLISASQVDHRRVTPRLVHLLLRAYWYFATYLGKTPPVDGPVNTYLLESGPPGAETYSQSLYFYAAETERSAIEWARQIGHEYGHLVLPAVAPAGGYLKPEMYASGLMGERLFIQWLALEAEMATGSPWPSQPARDALDHLLGDGARFDAPGYLAANVYPDLAAWHAAGPDSAYIGGTGEESMHYWIGMMLWVQSAFGTEGLREVVDGAAGPSAPEFLYALKAMVRKRAAEGAMSIDAGSLNVEASRLSETPVQGPLGWANVRLRPEDTAVFAAYVPQGNWRLRTTPAAPGLSLTFDGKGPFPIEAEQGLALGEVVEGWHSIEILSTQATTPLQSIQLTVAPEI